MQIALKYLSRLTDEVFAIRMQYAARKISERQHYFPRRVR